MKNKFAIINFALMIVVLFSMLSQSFHNYEHLIEQLSKKKCHEKHIVSGTQISHEHNNLEHCFACEFTFSNYIPLAFSKITFLNSIIIFKNSFFYIKEINQFYKGIPYPLRGPPRF